MELSQRRTPRYPFSGSAEITSAGLSQPTRVTELSLYGCYLEAVDSLPPRTRVTLKITTGGQGFEARASVLYSRPMQGMAVAFRDVKPSVLAILHEWLQQSLEQQNARPTVQD